MSNFSRCLNKNKIEDDYDEFALMDVRKRYTKLSNFSIITKSKVSSFTKEIEKKGYENRAIQAGIGDIVDEVKEYHENQDNDHFNGGAIDGEIIGPENKDNISPISNSNELNEYSNLFNKRYSDITGPNSKRNNESFSILSQSKLRKTINVHSSYQMNKTTLPTLKYSPTGDISLNNKLDLNVDQGSLNASLAILPNTFTPYLSVHSIPSNKPEQLQNRITSSSKLSMNLKSLDRKISHNSITPSLMPIKEYNININQMESDNMTCDVPSDADKDQKPENQVIFS